MFQPQQPVATVTTTVQVESPDGSSTDVVVMPLGSGMEVGRSAVLVSFKGKKVLLDCGIHPAKKGLLQLPNFDAIDCSEIDLVLITHFHLDHCGALPYLWQNTGFKGRVFMTRDTKAFYKMVMNDFMKVGTTAHDVVTKEGLLATCERIETIEYHQEKVHNGIRFQPFNAGHVLGAAMFQVDIGGVKILYTGDFSRSPDRHLPIAELPPVSPDILIVESTYGIQVHESREERELKFLTWVSEVVRRGGRCLVPVFALGRAQELLLVLEQYWQQNADLQRTPIYYASSMAVKSMKLYQNFVGSMNDYVKAQHDAHVNPFDFKFIQPLLKMADFKDDGPCVVLASPGMLQSGISLELFERWCPFPQNGIVLAGYSVEGTIAHKVTEKRREIEKDDGTVLKVNMKTIEYVSFSAHSDSRQTREFIRDLRDIQHVILVHGSEDSVRKLHKKLTDDFQHRNVKVHMPRNCERIAMPFNVQKTAKVIGRLAANGPPTTGEFVQGVLLVSGHNNHAIVHPDDVAAFTGLDVASVQQAMVLPFPQYRSATDVRTHLQTYFASTELLQEVQSTVTHIPTTSGDAATADRALIEVAGGVTIEVKHSAADQTTITIAWNTSAYRDLIADVSCAAVLQLMEGDESKALPMQVGAVDRMFRFKCFHHMMSQFFTAVHTDLVSGECMIVADGGEKLVIRECIDIAPLGTGKVSPSTFKHVSDILKRIYLTLFATPLDSGWCDCGAAHLESDGCGHDGH